MHTISPSPLSLHIEKCKLSHIDLSTDLKKESLENLPLHTHTHTVQVVRDVGGGRCGHCKELQSSGVTLWVECPAAHWVGGLGDGNENIQMPGHSTEQYNH